MRLKLYQWGELIGILFLLASTATQIFYVEPLKREIEWRLAAFSMQQNGQLQIKAAYANGLATLKAVNAPAPLVETAERERDALVARYETADANVANYLIDKQWIEGALQVIVIALFALGSLLAGFGRAMEMIAGRRIE